ncbi:CoA binding domain protein [Streptococcus parasanguinis ATCC 15912]|uniref:CoA binding domain protein n=2 Tax=Streptococcus parasanguinis TaxID=1318 RepID=F8DGD1_STREP|nr:CoA binding domain protein [Streptococcus parasanguinis ATCC 15912]
MFKTESGRKLFSFLPLLTTNTCNALRIVILFKERKRIQKEILMAYSFRNPSDGIIKHYLETSKIIAVVGLSDREDTTSHRVSKEMQERGYRIIPVNPRAAGGQILGETVYASLQEIPFPVDIVDVYRRSEFLPDVARDFIETDAKIFWAQLGLENQEAEEILQGAGREDIVMNRCIKREHTRLILGDSLYGL